MARMKQKEEKMMMEERKEEEERREGRRVRQVWMVGQVAVVRGMVALMAMEEDFDFLEEEDLGYPEEGEEGLVRARTPQPT